jgi:hypothetical protein
MQISARFYIAKDIRRIKNISQLVEENSRKLTQQAQFTFASFLTSKLNETDDPKFGKTEANYLWKDLVHLYLNWLLFYQPSSFYESKHDFPHSDFSRMIQKMWFLVSFFSKKKKKKN